MTSKRAFTLIEVLVVVAIIGLLISIATPSLKAARRISKKTQCLHNLHQIGLGVKAYLLVNKDRFPMIDELPSTPPLPGEPTLPSMPEVFKKEVGKNSEVFLCPADRITKPPMPGKLRYFDSEGTSYEWEAEANGAKVSFKRIRLPLLEGTPILPPLLREMHIISDFEEGWHSSRTEQGATNRLYADMHVATN